MGLIPKLLLWDPLQISCFYAVMLRRPSFHLPLRNLSMFATSFSFSINIPPAICHVLVYFGIPYTSTRGATEETNFTFCFL